MKDHLEKLQTAPSILETPVHIHAARIESYEYDNKSNHSVYYIESLFDQVRILDSNHSEEQLFMVIEKLNLENLSCISLTAILNGLKLYKNAKVFNRVFDYTMDYLVRLGSDPREVFTENGLNRK